MTHAVSEFTKKLNGIKKSSIPQPISKKHYPYLFLIFLKYLDNKHFENYALMMLY